MRLRRSPGLGTGAEHALYVHRNRMPPVDILRTTTCEAPHYLGVTYELRSMTSHSTRTRKPGESDLVWLARPSLPALSAPAIRWDGLASQTKSDQTLPPRLRNSSDAELGSGFETTFPLLPQPFPLDPQTSMFCATSHVNIAVIL